MECTVTVIRNDKAQKRDCILLLVVLQTDTGDLDIDSANQQTLFETKICEVVVIILI